MNNTASRKSQKIKIIFVAPSLDAGGAEKFLVDLLSNLNTEEFDFKLVLFGHAGFFLDELKSRGVEVEVLQKKFKIDVVNFCRLYSFIRKNRPDIVHTQLGGDVYGRLIAKLLGVKIIVSTEVGINVNEGFLMHLIKIWTARFATKIIAVSEAVRRDVAQRYLVSLRRVELIYNGLDVARFSGFKKAPRASDRIIFGGLGRLSPEKNWPTLIRALALMKNKNVDCIIGGAGEMRTELEFMADDLGVKKRIKFLGLVKDVPEFMAGLDFFVLPSTREAFGIVLIEAGMFSLPVLAAAVGGVTEIIDNNKTGFLFNPRSTADLAEKLDYMAENIDNPVVKKMGADLHDFVQKNFDIKIITAKYEKLYKDLYNKK
ncbi:MAG: glycosyltransferase [Candidatus Falkowbacteria bacterium]